MSRNATANHLAQTSYHINILRVLYKKHGNLILFSMLFVDIEQHDIGHNKIFVLLKYHIITQPILVPI